MATLTKKIADPVKTSKSNGTSRNVYTINQMEAEIVGQVLVIRVPLETPRLSATGKTMVCASTGGFKKTEAELQGKQLSINVTAIIPIGK